MTKATATPSDIAQCKAIFNRIGDLIPGRGYVAQVREELLSWGVDTPYSDAQIQQVRAGRIFHLEVAQAFERLYAPKAQSVTHSLAKRQKLVPPISFSS
jgi:hypothetical protein